MTNQPRHLPPVRWRRGQPVPFLGSLRNEVPRDHHETDEAHARRRRIVTGVGITGATFLGLSLSSEPGSRRFYVLACGVAATWAGGALGSGPLHLGQAQRRDQSLHRPLVTPVVTGVGAFGVFYGAARACRHVPAADGALRRVLRYADRGSTPLVLLTTCANGVAEELFFRGALYAAVGRRHPVAKSTAAYVVATASTRNPALVLASLVMGVLFGWQRRASGGVGASALTHLTWSVLMVRYLPPLFRIEKLDLAVSGMPTEEASRTQGKRTRAVGGFPG
ncbi:MAG TPA: type II CAAX endopeptidase family protein [Dermatophilaceae bacterium]